LKDENKREKGTYKEEFYKIQNEVKYIKTEITVVGRNYEILNYNVTYNPPMIFGKELGHWIKI
jgi:hypothetical protein